MPSWTQVQAHARSKYTLADDQASMLSMVWTYEDGRSQKVVVRRFSAFNKEMIEFKSAFARTTDVDQEVMLRRNSKLPLATVALSGDVYLAVYNMLLEHLNLDDFDLVISRVAAVADSLEEEFSKRDEF